MNKWEYKTVRSEFINTVLLNELGSSGWEVINQERINYLPWSVVYVTTLKRNTNEN